ncbi:hypothetical protein Q4577_02435 [Marinovum sp. 2_MG-2023]|uniref:hypothetical protein n=1 Tax=Roseobacteraceae TaxID=2854170 RepID=UPI001FD348A5|nr:MULTISPECIES: hypothetical protein [Roseobacteraceae]MCJ7874674.1 hypothetical protein [Phaeobacter sp. J2-8]MDO6728856.1 hypothetical protein [Marinovum sp. 2_MG-2023]MDO6777728.1 hypothetical protein [Marinovum sp. 1_MG-2023]
MKTLQFATAAALALASPLMAPTMATAHVGTDAQLTLQEVRFDGVVRQAWLQPSAFLGPETESQTEVCAMPLDQRTAGQIACFEN